MSVERTVTVQKRPGQGWGLYLMDEKRWLDVTFARQSDAEKMAQLLQGGSYISRR